MEPMALLAVKIMGLRRRMRERLMMSFVSAASMLKKVLISQGMAIKAIMLRATTAIWLVIKKAPASSQPELLFLLYSLRKIGRKMPDRAPAMEMV